MKSADIRKFRNRFPKLIEADDELLKVMSEAAREFEPSIDTSSMRFQYLVAHLTTLGEIEGEGITNGGIEEAEEGTLGRMTYMHGVESPQDVFYLRTRYGRVYLEMRNMYRYHGG